MKIAVEMTFGSSPIISHLTRKGKAMSKRESLPAFLEPLFPGRSFAIAESAVLPHKEKLDKAGIKYKKVIVAVDEYDIKACVFSARSSLRATERFILVLAIIPVDTSNFTLTCITSKGAVMPFFAGRPCGTARIDFEKDNPKDEEEQRLKYGTAITCYEKLLSRFSIITGYDVCLHADECDFNVRPPLPESPRCLHIFTNASPPGEINTRWLHGNDGLPVVIDGKRKKCMKPVPGRGIIVRGKDGEPFAQVIGSNFYFPLPMFSPFDQSVSPKAFELLLVHCWDAFQENREQSKKREEPQPLSNKKFIETIYEWLGTYPKAIEGIIEEDCRELEEKRREIIYLERGIYELSEHLRLLKSEAFLCDTKHRIKKEWKQIVSMPDIARLDIVDDGLQGYTKRIVIPGDDGFLHNTGSYTIRINRRGLVSVWSEDPAVSGRGPHPHISEDGHPCYGNATDAISRAGAQHRYADVFAYVLKWLKYGYAPALATVKIEKWPVVLPDSVSSENKTEAAP